MIFKKFLEMKRGQAVMEYVMITAAMTAIFVLGFVDFFGDDTHPCSLFQKIYDEVYNKVYVKSYEMINRGWEYNPGD